MCSQDAQKDYASYRNMTNYEYTFMYVYIYIVVYIYIYIYIYISRGNY